MGMFCVGWSGTPARSSASTSWSRPAIHALEKVRLMNPGPLTSTESHTPSRSSAATILAATSRGGIPTFLASASAALTCTSANCDGRSTGSASRKSSPRAVAIADWTLGVSATSGETMPAVYLGQSGARARVSGGHRGPTTSLPARYGSGQGCGHAHRVHVATRPAVTRPVRSGSLPLAVEPRAAGCLLVVEPHVGLGVVVAGVVGTEERRALTPALDRVAERLRAVGDGCGRAESETPVDDLVETGHPPAGRRVVDRPGGVGRRRRAALLLVVAL